MIWQRDEVLMKYLLAVLSTAFLAGFLLGSCSGKDAPVTSATSTKPPANLSEGSSGKSAAGKPEGQEAKASEIPSAEAKTAEAQKGEAKTGGPDTKKPDTKKPDAEKPDTEGVEQKNVRLLIDDQTTAGQIVIKQVSTSRDGWVSIHQSNENGSIRLPDSIGQARVDAGDNKDVIVDLWEAPAIDDKLWALLHIDAGDRGTYEFPEKDLPVKKNGETVARSFVIKGKEEKKDDAE